MRTFLRPIAVAASGLVATTLVATTLTVPAHAAPADDAGLWLEGELVDGLAPGDFAEGLSIDMGFVFAEVGMVSARTRVRDALAPRVENYTGPGDEIYVAPLSKVLTFVQVAEGDATDFAGKDLVAELEKQVTMRPRRLRGRLADRSQYGDFATTIAQLYGARGLARAGSPKADEVIDFLLEQQCSPGFFRLSFSRTGKADQSCDAARGDAAAPDIDITALAVWNLQSLPRSFRTKGTRSAVRDAVAWFRRKQRANGKLGGGATTSASNSNSTGLVAHVMGRAGACRPARDAARWILDLQVRGDESGTPFEGEEGAIGYTRAAYKQARAEGITSESRAQWRRATAQAALGLRFVAGC